MAKRPISNGRKTEDSGRAATQFKPGNPGGPGRPKGSRNKLEEDMLRDLCAAWEEHGAEAITAVLAEHPADFLKICAGLLPKQIEAEVRTQTFVRAPEKASDADWKTFLLERDKPVAAPVKRTNGSSNGTTH